MTEPGITIRPRFWGSAAASHWRRSLYLAPLIVIGFANWDLGLGATLWVVGGLAAFVAVVYALTFEFLGHASLSVVDGNVTRTAWLRPPASRPLDAITQVVELPLRLYRLDYTDQLWLLFLGEDDRTLMRAYSEYYRVNELLRFRTATGVPWTRSRELTPAQARRLYPDAFPWPLAHYGLVLLGGVLGALCVTEIVQVVITGKW